MLVYKPSVGNQNTPVGVSPQERWFGESLGGSVLLRLKTETTPTRLIESDLDESSTWFFKEITDTDFIRGNTVYRAMYIGASDLFKDESEVINNVSVSVDVDIDDARQHLIPTILDSIKVDIYYEGKFNTLNANRSKVILGENDITDVLPNVGWGETLSIGEVFKSGEFGKFWIRYSVDKDISMLDIDNFSYIINIHDLSIKVHRTPGRMNISKVYMGDIVQENEYILHQLFPYNISTDQIVKIIEKNDLINVFYFDEEGKFRDLVIQPDRDIAQNKYLNIDLSAEIPNITSSTQMTYSTFSNCIRTDSEETITEGATGYCAGDTYIIEVGNPGGYSPDEINISNVDISPSAANEVFENLTSNPYVEIYDTKSGIFYDTEIDWSAFGNFFGLGVFGIGVFGVASDVSGSIQLNFEGCVDANVSGASGDDIFDLLGEKFIIDIFATEKDFNNDFYVFYNEFQTDADEEYIRSFGHQQYFWNTGVIHIDLSSINEKEFDNIDPGIENMKYFTASYMTTDLKIYEQHFMPAVVQIDDAFVGIGFDVEDCRTTYNKTFVESIWERDIIRQDLNVQRSSLPNVPRTMGQTVENKSTQNGIIVFDMPDQIEYFEREFYRQSITLTDGNEVVNMASPHGKRIYHGFSSVSYDIDEEYESFSSTYSFGIDIDSIAISGEGPGTTGTTGSPPVDPSGSFVEFDENVAYHNLLKLQSVQDDFISGAQTMIGTFDDSGYDFVETTMEILRLHCNGELDTWAMKLFYNFPNNKWYVQVKDKLSTIINIELFTEKDISFLENNVITVNVNRVQVYGCGKKYLLNVDIDFGGENIWSGVTYTSETTENFILTHNPLHHFAGFMTYVEVRNDLSNHTLYNKAQYQINTNLTWEAFEQEQFLEQPLPGFESFSYRRKIFINNLVWNNGDELVYPIVLYGNSYNVGTEYNRNVRKEVFDVSRINLSNPSLSFTYEGESTELNWFAEPYDTNKDFVVVWVRLPDWNGQRISMYYGDSRVINDELRETPYAPDYFSSWHMDKFVPSPIIRTFTQNIFNCGEPVIACNSINGNFVAQINKQYKYGNETLYKSNEYDIIYDDREVERDREEYIAEFIRENVDHFSPAFRKVRNVRGRFKWNVEADQEGTQQ